MVTKGCTRDKSGIHRLPQICGFLSVYVPSCNVSDILKNIIFYFTLCVSSMCPAVAQEVKIGGCIP